MWAGRAERAGPEVAHRTAFYASLGAFRRTSFPLGRRWVGPVVVARPDPIDRDRAAEAGAPARLRRPERRLGRGPRHPARRRPRQGRRARPPRRDRPARLATFALAKLVAKEKVDAWVREPFVEERPDGGVAPKGRRPALRGRRAADLHALRRHLERAGPRRPARNAPARGARRHRRPRRERRQRLAQAGFNWVCARSNAAQAAASPRRSRRGRSGSRGGGRRGSGGRRRGAGGRGAPFAASAEPRAGRLGEGKGRIDAAVGSRRSGPRHFCLLLGQSERARR